MTMEATIDLPVRGHSTLKSIRYMVAALIFLSAAVIHHDHSQIASLLFMDWDNEVQNQNEVSVLSQHTVTESTNQQLSQLSSVDYAASMGLGHRLTRMAGAYSIAKRFNFMLRTYWGSCGDNEIYQYMFGPPRLEDIRNVTSTNLTIKQINEVGGFRKLVRDSNAKCMCTNEDIADKVEFFQSLRDRFRHKDMIDKFVKTNFQGHTVFGIHVRAGNGEKGDFEVKGRGIANATFWVKDISRHIVNYSNMHNFTSPPALFVASDTPSMIENFRQELNSTMPVIEVPQERVEEGQGIAVFEGKLKGSEAMSETRHCFEGWETAMKDMVVLSHVDLLFMPRPSSFSQSMPLSLVSAKQAVSQPLCEMNFNGTNMFCYDSFKSWCCDGSWERIRNHGPIYEDVKVRVENYWEVNFTTTTRGTETVEECMEKTRVWHCDFPHLWKSSMV